MACSHPEFLPLTRSMVLRYALGALVLASSVAALEVKPDRIEFKSIQDSASLTLRAGGAAVAPSEVKSVKLMVGQHDYDHMIQVSNEAGQVVVQPTDLLEMGTYDLAIATAQGSVSVPVVALFESVDGSFEAQAARQGVTVAKLKESLGLTQTLRTERIRLNLPPLYYQGQTMKLELPVAEGRTAKWLVNGEEFDPENGTFSHVFEKTGVYDIGYIEHVDGSTVAFSTGTVRVVPEPAIPVQVAAGTRLTLNAPSGYGKYAWRVDDEDAGVGAEWAGVFERPGTHTAVVRASEPSSDAHQAFRVLTYAVTVTAEAE